MDISEIINGISIVIISGFILWFAKQFVKILQNQQNQNFINKQFEKSIEYLIEENKKRSNNEKQ